MKKRTFENLPPAQQASKRYTDSVALGAFRNVSCDDAPAVALASVACSSVCFTNMSGKTIGVQRGGTGVVIFIPNEAGKVFDVSANANELSVFNNDDATSITVEYECGGEIV